MDKNRIAVALIVAVAVAAVAFYVIRKQAPVATHPPAIESTSAEPQVIAKIQSLRKEVEADPESGDKWGELAKNFHIHGFKDQAIFCYKKAAELDPAQFQWPYLVAILMEDSGSVEAFQFYRRAGELRKDFAPLLLREANLLLREGKTVEAESMFHQVIAKDAKCWAAYLGLAQIAVSKQQLEEAQQWLNKALHTNPKYSEAYSLLANIYRQTNEPQKAERAVRLAARLPKKTVYPDPVYADLVSEGVSSYWHRVRGRAHLERGNYAEAQKEFETALKVNPDAESYNNLGAVVQRSGELQKAIELYEKSVATRPNAVAYANLGAAYGKLARYDECIEASKHAIALQKDSVDAYLNLGIAYSKTNRCAEALPVLREAIRLKPEHASAHYLLAECYLRLGDRKSAYAEVMLLRKLDPKLASRFQ